MNRISSVISLFCLLFISYTTNSQSQAADASTHSSAPDSISRNITFLNAANFDFSNNLSGSYLGKINIFAPNIKNRLGFNAGILRIKYSYKDSSNAPLVFQNILLHPLDTIKQGTKYVREYNKFTSTRSNTVWSFFIQPMIRIGKDSTATSQVFIHFHGELLVSKVNITTSIENIQRDTVTMSSSFREPFVIYQKTPLIFDKTYLNGYFGIGLTFSLDPFHLKNSRFFFQPTIGVTTNYPNWTSQDIYASNDTIIAPNTVIPTRGGLAYRKEPFPPTKTNFFYLIRSEFSQLLSTNAQLILGSEIRGLFPRYNPMYSAYIGLNVNLDALVKVVTGKT